MISENAGRYAKMKDPTTEEGLSDSFCSDRSEGNDFRLTCESIHTSEQVGRSL